jgi:hypothetical protein
LYFVLCTLFASGSFETSIQATPSNKEQSTKNQVPRTKYQELITSFHIIVVNGQRSEMLAAIEGGQTEMRQQVIAVLALAGFILLPIQVKGQDKDSSDKTWPSLGSAEKTMPSSAKQRWGDERRPRFLIEYQKLEVARNVSNPLGITRCDPSSEGCFVWLGDFFSELKGSMKESILRPGVMMHHYPQVLFERHHRTTGTYVFYLPKQKVFYLWGDCMMGHGDLVQGPFAGDPRQVLKKLAEDPDSVAQFGELIVPFQAQGQGLDSSDEAWPGIPISGIDKSKLERAQNVFNPLSLDRCRASAEKCVMKMEDFSSKRRNRLGTEKWVLRPDVIAHYYPGSNQQYVFYLRRQNIFYVGGYDPSSSGLVVLGPFAGDPRLVLKKFTEDTKPI